jgi:hypothetical protein
MKIKNLKRLVARLEAQIDSPSAARFNMHYFGNQYFHGAKNMPTEYPPVCKTQACLAGETVLEMGTGVLMPDGGIKLNNPSMYFPEQAGNDLGLDLNQRRRLFYFATWGVGNIGWPVKFETAYTAAKTPQGRLYVAIRRVEHFIKTHGRE